MISVEKREEVRKRYFDCDHKNYERRKMKLSNASWQVKNQCLDCGITSQAKKRQPGDDNLKEIDAEFKSSEQNKRQEAFNRHMEGMIEAERQKMQFEYGQYLQTEEWRQIRNKILERDGRLCRGCLVKIATCVHHLTYDNVGDELCFQLVSLCDDCHNKAHNKDDK